MDRARKQTDKILSDMEKKITAIYTQSQLDIQYRWDQYMQRVKPEADKLLADYEAAKLSGDKALIQSTGKKYGQFVREMTITNKYYQDMIDQTTSQLSHVNETALAYVNSHMPEIYAINYNAIAGENLGGYSFDLVDQRTVSLLMNDDPDLIPQKHINVRKDKRWNKKAINGQVLQGILGGESIDKIAARLSAITAMNEASARRNARTMTTSAENKGRLDSYKKAEENGVVMEKVWMATGDERTREAHMELNGQRIPVDEPFVNSIGEIMCPGDTAADASNVWNCRCSMKSYIIGFRRADGSISKVKR